MVPVVPIAVAGAIGLLAWKKSKKKGMTPKRKQIFEALMKTQKDPAKLRQAAAVYEKEGCRAEAAELRKRAAIFEMQQTPKGQAILSERKAVFKKAMDSHNPVAIKRVAAAFHKVGHYEAASQLRKMASGLFKSGGVSGTAKIGAEDGFAGEANDSIAEV